MELLQIATAQFITKCDGLLLQIATPFLLQSLSKLRHFVPPKTLFGIYNSLIFPYLSYGLVAWGQAAKTHLEKLLTLQKRAVRLINFAPFRSHAVPYFFTLILCLLECSILSFLRCLCLMFTITLPLLIFHISLFLLNKFTLTALAPLLLEIITLATLD